MDELQVCLVSRAKQLFNGSASYVSAPSTEGSVGILPGRQPLLATLQPGKVEITISGQSEPKTFMVDKGFISVDNNQIMIVVDSIS